MRTIIIFIFLFTGLFADVSARYTISFGIFGQIGIAQTTLHVSEDKRYEISVHAYTTGFAKAISGARQEWYTSRGSIDDAGIFVPDVYEKSVQREVFRDDARILKKDIKRYIFLHPLHQVIVEKIKQNDQAIHSEMLQNEFYAPNDLLSLFFNFKSLLPSLDVKERIVYVAVGANKKDGKIELNPLEYPKAARDDLGWSGGHLLRVLIRDDIFSSANGALLLRLDDDGFAQNAVLKDVLFFGDIRGERIE